MPLGFVEQIGADGRGLFWVFFPIIETKLETEVLV